MVQTFLLFDTITNEKTVKFLQRDIITSTITWHLGLVGSNNFGEYTSFSPFTLACTGWGLHNEDFLVIRECFLSCLACPSNPLLWCVCFTSLFVSSSAVAEKLLKVLALLVGFWKLHLVYLDFSGTSSLSIGSRCL